MVEPCIGFLEFSSIAKGIYSTDALLKKAPVTIVFSRPVSSGKFLTLFTGEVEAVRSSLEISIELAGNSLIDFFLIPNIHPQIPKTLNSSKKVKNLEALGILETKTCACCIETADIALKETDVQLLRIHLAQGIGGKSYFVVDGEVADVETSLLAAAKWARAKNALLEKVVITQATPELLGVLENLEQPIERYSDA